MDAEEFQLDQRVFLMNSGQYANVEEIFPEDNSLLVCVEGSGICRRVNAWDIDTEEKEYTVVERIYRTYTVRARSREDAEWEALHANPIYSVESGWEIINVQEVK